MFAILLLIFLFWTGLSFLYAKVLVRKNAHLQKKVIQLTVIGAVASPVLFMMLGLVSMNFFLDYFDLLAGNNTLILINNLGGALLLLAIPLLPVWVSVRAMEKN